MVRILRTTGKAAFFAILLFLVVFGMPKLAAAQSGTVYDEAELLNEDETAALNELLETFAIESGWNVYAVTTVDAQGKTASAYADDFFDEHSPKQEDGVVLLIDMEHREIVLSTCGIAIRYLTDAKIDAILDDAYGDISDGDYAGCFRSMISGVRSAYGQGISDNQYNYDEETGEISEYHHISKEEMLISFAVAAAVGAVVFSGIVGVYRLKIGNYHYDAHKFSRVRMNRQEDIMIHQAVTHRRIQTQNSGGSHGGGGNRSTTHRSSSGRSHGGGSRKF